jgi:UDP-N-acetylglucosamine 2-epimerase (non-hydrolysing)
VKVVSVVGARPQFVKLATIHRALVARGHDHIIIHTGQHYDPAMSDVFFDEFDLPAPDLNLNVGSLDREAQINAISKGLELPLTGINCDWVLVYGDTNSTLGAALAAKRANLSLAHLEAGVRSFNQKMPEELNRVQTDQISDLLLAPTKIALKNLHKEGLSAKSHLVGDVMTDLCLMSKQRVLTDKPSMPENWRATDSEPYIMATVHRESNTEDGSKLNKIISYLARSPMTVRLIVHPRLRDRAKKYEIKLDRGLIEVYEPLSYLQFIYAMLHSKGLVTDSGGLQKEAFLLGVPCVTLRNETEWTETVELGWNVLDPNCRLDLENHFSKVFKPTDAFPFGVGNSAHLAIEVIEKQT